MTTALPVARARPEGPFSGNDGAFLHLVPDSEHLGDSGSPLASQASAADTSETASHSLGSNNEVDNVRHGHCAVRQRHPRHRREAVSTSNLEGHLATAAPWKWRERHGDTHFLPRIQTTGLRCGNSSSVTFARAGHRLGQAAIGRIADAPSGRADRRPHGVTGHHGQRPLPRHHPLSTASDYPLDPTSDASFAGIPAREV